jgi:hypothetical protein
MDGFNLLDRKDCSVKFDEITGFINITSNTLKVFLIILILLIREELLGVIKN